MSFPPQAHFPSQPSQVSMVFSEFKNSLSKRSQLYAPGHALPQQMPYPTSTRPIQNQQPGATHNMSIIPGGGNRNAKNLPMSRDGRDWSNGLCGTCCDEPATCMSSTFLFHFFRTDSGQFARVHRVLLPLYCVWAKQAPCRALTQKRIP